MKNFFDKHTDFKHFTIMQKLFGRDYLGLLLVILLLFLGFIVMAQQNTYILKGTAEQMIALRMALEKSKAPYDEVVKVQEWLIPQLIQQDQAFAKAEEDAKVKQDSVKAKSK